MGPSRSTKLLDFYSHHGVELALTRYGLIEALRERGFNSPRIAIDTQDRSHQVIRVRGDREQHIDVLLIELVMRRKWIDDPSQKSRSIEVLSLEWLLLQDPTRNFTLSRPPLPGQTHPGLGVALELLEVLVQAGLRLGLEGLLNNPAYFHTALGLQEFVFIDPQEQGEFEALQKLLRGSIDDVSRAIDEGRVSWRDGEPVRWRSGRVLLPLSESQKAWFAGAEYRDAVAVARQRAEARGLRSASAAVSVQPAIAEG